MNLKSIFLTLSIKQQICITIVALNLFCILVILSICCSLSYEIIKKDFNQKKLYFYKKYQQYIESCSYFQNFYILQYEEIVKRMQRQFWEYFNVINIYNLNFNFENDDNKKLSEIEFKRTDINKQNNSIIIDNNDFLFYSCYYKYSQFCVEIKNILIKQYNSLSSLIFFHDKNSTFRIPIYDNIPLIDTPTAFECY